MTPDMPSAAVALLAMRLVAGILFFFQGYDKLFRLKTGGVLNVFRESFSEKKIPLSPVRAGIVASSVVELACGALLAVGLFRELALCLLAVDLVFVAFMFSLLKPMWDMGHFFPRFVLVTALLLLPAEYDLFCLDRLF